MEALQDAGQSRSPARRKKPHGASHQAGASDEEIGEQRQGQKEAEQPAERRFEKQSDAAVALEELSRGLYDGRREPGGGEGVPENVDPPFAKKILEQSLDDALQMADHPHRFLDKRRADLVACKSDDPCENKEQG